MNCEKHCKEKAQGDLGKYWNNGEGSDLNLGVRICSLWVTV